MVKISKQPQTPSEEAGPGSKPHFQATSDSPQTLDHDFLSSLTGSLSVRDQEIAEHGQPQKPDNPNPPQSGSGSHSEMTPARPAPASRESPTDRSGGIRREQIRYQVHRTLDLMSMVCWGDLKAAVSALRRSYLLALRRIERGDQNTPLFDLNDPDPDPDLSHDNHRFTEEYQDWVFPVEDNSVVVHFPRRIRRHRRRRGETRVVINDRAFPVGEAIVVRLHGPRSRSRSETGRCRNPRYTQAQGHRAGHAARRGPAPLPRGQGNHLRQSLHNLPEDDTVGNAAHQTTEDHSQTNTATVPPPGDMPDACEPSSRPCNISSGIGPKSPHHTARYRQEWINFIRREAHNNPFVL
ncbi:uncharacterized protein Z519_03405 [Cladophialophora bantiana CBS 173.52]|uniref:Uncharacterized protein n=1 Tax=Cladophialophora bantiana (strain ATCC 10958 / CBS 173.52 / CDC B-1940 / NIH 8579) TaxID=1442370 RepID=A0A0D2F281_CLAB1|nr:uncharacterized protein Z519_03405 [Cladophialophora bantiana CBS 173.52]KIW96336.1 hypothetical protein Z519_03405 [Cladophialophora bantiana CBS 173.52]